MVAALTSREIDRPISRKRAQLRRVSAAIPNLDAIDCIAAHCERCSPWCSSTRATALSLTSGGYLRFRDMTSSSQGIWSPSKPGRFSRPRSQMSSSTTRFDWGRTRPSRPRTQGAAFAGGKGKPEDAGMRSGCRLSPRGLQTTTGSRVRHPGGPGRGTTHLRGLVAEVASRSDLTPGDVILRFGLHWGSSPYVGNISTPGRSEVTALGDEVNDAARIEACASGGRTLASKNLIERLEPADAADLDLDSEHAIYTPLGELSSATEKARRDAPMIPVCEIPPAAI